MTPPWDLPVSGKEAIPKGEQKAKVRIRLIGHDRMVEAVHVGGDDNPLQDKLQGRRQRGISVLEAA